MTELSSESNSSDIHEDRVEIVFYTDPLCCWSWALEPQWRRLRYEFEGKLTWRYCMGGLIPNWTNYNDPMNSVHRPSQMGPLWMEAKHISGMPIQDTIWLFDPPASSYPSCIAVKSAELQSSEAAENLLRSLRQAIMIEGKNIAKQEVILEVAEMLGKEDDSFDVDIFKNDFLSNAGLPAFREDLQRIKLHNIGRFPTLTITRPGKKGIIITGYRPYHVLRDAFSSIAPDLLPKHDIDLENYTKYWPHLTEREIEEVSRHRVPFNQK